jgi:hypothetical protein
MPLTNTQALMAELATALSLPEVPLSATGGFELTVGEGGTIQMFSQGEAGLLIVAPVGPLPVEASYPLAHYLLRMNMFDTDMRPFRVAVDEGGGIIVWGSVQVEGLTGAALAEAVQALADQVGGVRAELFGDTDEEDAAEEEEEEQEDEAEDDEDEDEDEAAAPAS